MATQPYKIQVLQPSQDQDAWKLFVFCKNRQLVPARVLTDELYHELELLAGGGGNALDALVRAGELETALADGTYPEQVIAARITDQLASLVCGEPVDLQQIRSFVSRTRISALLRCSHPEGFSYYGLNPLDFAEVTFHLRSQIRSHAAVIGIRSVGSALGAVVAAVLRAGNSAVERITVRPEGEPYKRVTRFNANQLDWVRRKLRYSSDFFVVDEGPGFSGSTLLSVVRALEASSVPAGSITIICSRPIDDRLNMHGCGDLRNYRSVIAGYGRRLPPEADRQAGMGLWRQMLYPDNSEWPACWTYLERIKHLSVDATALFKFEGLGRYGALARRQAQVLAEADFSPALLGFENGFARYRFEHGRPLSHHHLSPLVITRMAEYCAFRAKRLSAPFASMENLLNMMQLNLELEFGCGNPFTELPIVSPVYADCRMMPHEWVQTVDGRILKTDSVGHGEGHQLPGSVDIAWDLAGVIVDWDLSRSETEFFLSEYRRLSGDDAASRIQQYVLCYLTYRTAYCRMGAACMRQSSDGAALWNQYRQYAAKLEHHLLLS